MKIKVFSEGFIHEPPDSFESEINDWLQQGVEIQDKLVSTCTGVNGLGQTFVNVTIVFLYRERS